MTRPARLPGLLASLVLALLPAARAESTLAPTSPFLPPNAPAGGAAADNQPLELRGIMLDHGTYRFSIYDPAKRTGQWVRLNEPGHDFTVRSHDVAHDSVTLDYQGQTMTLPLHTAKVAGLVVNAPPSGPQPNPVAGTFIGGRQGPGPARLTPAEEAARFSRAQEEIARRRAERNRGAAPPPK